MKKRYFLLFLLTYSMFMLGVTDEPIRFNNFNSKQGLSNDWVNSITEDDRGFLWIATRNGLNVYDGNQNTIYKYDYNEKNTISHNDVSEVKYTSKGIIFVGTWGGGLNMINARTRQITRIGDTDFERSLTIKSIVEDSDSTVWIGTYGQGVFSYNHKSKKLVKCLESISHAEPAYCQDIAFHNDTIWVVTRGNGLAYIPTQTSKKLTYIKEENPNAKIPEDLTYLHFINHELYMGSYDGQVLIYNRSSYTTDTLLNLKLDKDHHNRVNSILQDSKENLWMATSSGLFKYAQTTRNLTRINQPETGEEYNDNFSSFIDSRGIFWLGNWGNGIYSHLNADNKFKTISLAKPNRNIVQSIVSLNDSIFLFGTANGILEYDIKTKEIRKINASGKETINISKNIVNGILPYQDKFLVATDGAGLFLMDKNYNLSNFKNHYNSNLFNSSIIGVNSLGNGDRLIGSWAKGGVLVNEKSELYREFNSLTENDSSIHCNTVYCAFHTQDNRTLIGTEGGIIEYNRTTNSFSPLPLFVHIKNDKSPLKAVRSITQDSKGFLWVASIFGLVKYDLKTNNDERLFTEKTGLINKTIHNMIFINESIWATTKGGLMEINTVSNKINNFTVTDGLSGNAFNDNGLLYKDNLLYLANGYDIIYFNPDSIQKHPHHANIQILEFKLDDKTVTEEDKILPKHISFLESIELKYFQNNLSFDVSVIDYNTQNDSRFVHKLEGFDNKWIQHKYSDTKIRYTNLEPGKYTLILASVLEDDSISDITKTVQIYVSTPFWETIWFRLFMLFLIVALLIVFIRLSITRVAKKNKELEHLVSNRTKELSLSNHKLKEQNKAVESNIRYASVLQEALLPSEEKIASGFKNSFVFNQPKDGVSGDFFWFTKVNDKSIFVAADCTGHGVSGAFVSVFGVSSLSSIIENRNIIRPDLILNELHDKVTSAFHQNETTVRDGMDISVITYDEKTKVLEISSAKASPLFIMDNTDLIRLKGDKYPIGGSDDAYPNREKFILKTMKVTEPSTIYLFSDGFQDQFGGKDGKKYMQKMFREFLFSNCNKDIKLQEQILRKEFYEWMGENDQVDDVLVVGIQLS